MLCENMQGREEDELLGMAEIFLGTNVKIGEWTARVVSSIFFSGRKRTNDNLCD